MSLGRSICKCWVLRRGISIHRMQFSSGIFNVKSYGTEIAGVNKQISYGTENMNAHETETAKLKMLLNQQMNDNQKLNQSWNICTILLEHNRLQYSMQTDINISMMNELKSKHTDEMNSQLLIDIMELQVHKGKEFDMLTTLIILNMDNEEFDMNNDTDEYKEYMNFVKEGIERNLRINWKLKSMIQKVQKWRFETDQSVDEQEYLRDTRDQLDTLTKKEKLWSEKAVDFLKNDAMILAEDTQLAIGPVVQLYNNFQKIEK